jgi:transposase
MRSPFSTEIVSSRNLTLVHTREHINEVQSGNTKEVHEVPGVTTRYPPEFKREAVRLLRSSPNRSVAQIARELGVSDNSVRNWVKQFEMDRGEREGLTTEEREELSKLRKKR